MNEPILSAGTVNLTKRIGDPPLIVDLLRYFEFTYAMSEELEDLVARYRHDSHELQSVDDSLQRSVPGAAAFSFDD